MSPKTERFDALVSAVRNSRLPSPDLRRQTREAAEITIREAARALDVSPMTYLRWERGDVQPRRAHAVEYKEFLDTLKATAP